MILLDCSQMSKSSQLMISSILLSPVLLPFAQGHVTNRKFANWSGKLVADNHNADFTIKLVFIPVPLHHFDELIVNVVYKLRV